MIGDIFSRDDGHERQAYWFEMPEVAFSGDDIAVDLHDKRWHLTQQRTHAEDGPPWTASGDTLATAVLALIAQRLGYSARFERDPEDDGEPRAMSHTNHCEINDGDGFCDAPAGFGVYWAPDVRAHLVVDRVEILTCAQHVAAAVLALQAAVGDSRMHPNVRTFD